MGDFLVKLVLLPGMDGTGALFEPLLNCLPSTIETTVIPLPQSGPQDYGSLAIHVRAPLPNEPFFLLAESFSGPIAAALDQCPDMQVRGLVFAASFIEPIRHPLLPLAKLLPLSALMSLPLSQLALKHFMLGHNGPRSDIARFANVVRSVPSSCLRARLGTVSSFPPVGYASDTPSLYLRATGDRLIDASASDAFASTYQNLIVKDIDGPHFVLQAKPQQCAGEILAFMGATL